jgi:hypothetical protein
MKTELTFPCSRSRDIALGYCLGRGWAVGPLFPLGFFVWHKLSAKTYQHVKVVLPLSVIKAQCDDTIDDKELRR